MIATICCNCGKEKEIAGSFCTQCGNVADMPAQPQAPDMALIVAPEQNMYIIDPPSAEEVCRKLQSHAKTSNILWLIVGILQVISVIFIFAGAWNVIRSIIGLSNVKNIVPGNSRIPPYFKGRLPMLIFGLAWNFIVGGVIPAGLSIYDLWIRDYAIKNQQAFY